MEKVFLTVCHMAVMASFVMAAVLAARLLLKKAPKMFTMLLWGLVALRLILPFSVESAFSLVPKQVAHTEPAVVTAAASATYTTQSRVTSVPTALSVTQTTKTSDTVTATVTVAPPAAVVTTVTTRPTASSVASTTESIPWTTVGICVWVCGMLAMLLYSVWQYWRLRRLVRASIRWRDNVFVCDDIDSPCILGVFRPHIYCPSDLTEEELAVVVAHENAHLQRLDHLTKLFGFLLLCVYWFHPLVWLCFVLFCRDLETACDERVIRSMNAEQKTRYSEVLLACSAKHSAASMSLAFGEIGVKSRLKAILHYKKPTFWIVLAAIVAIVAVAVCFLTVPVTNTPQTKDTNPAASDHETTKPTDLKVEDTPKRNNTFQVVGPDGEVVLTYLHLQDARASYTMHNESEVPTAVVMITLNKEGTALFAEKTKQYIGEELSVTIDGETVFEATVNEPITDGELYILGGDIDSIKDAEEMAYRLMYQTEAFRPSGEYTLPLENWQTDGLMSIGLDDYRMTMLAEGDDKKVYLLSGTAVDSTNPYTALAVETENKVFVVGMGGDSNITEVQLCEMDGRTGDEVVVCKETSTGQRTVTVYTVRDSSDFDNAKLYPILLSENEYQYSRFSSVTLPEFKECVVDEQFGNIWMFEHTDLQPLFGAAYDTEGFPLVSDTFLLDVMPCRYEFIDEESDGVVELAMYAEVYSGYTDNSVGEYCTKYRYDEISRGMTCFEASFFPKSDKLKEITRASFGGMIGEQTLEYAGMQFPYPIVQGVGNDSAINQTLPVAIAQCVEGVLNANDIYDDYEIDVRLMDVVYIPFESDTKFSLVYHATYFDAFSDYPVAISFAVTVDKQSGKRLTLNDLVDIEQARKQFVSQYAKYDRVNYHEPLTLEDYLEMLTSCDMTYDLTGALNSFVCNDTVCILRSAVGLYWSFVIRLT